MCCTYEPILTIYTSYDVFLCKDVLFGGSVDTSLYLGGHMPKTVILGAWIGIFKPNVSVTISSGSDKPDLLPQVIFDAVLVAFTTAKASVSLFWFTRK